MHRYLFNLIVFILLLSVEVVQCRLGSPTSSEADAENAAAATRELPGTTNKAVVFDIDGTLTVGQLNFFKPRPLAVDAVTAWMDKGYTVILLTRRPEIMRRFTERSLRRWGFPRDELALYMPKKLPLTDEATIAFKRDKLLELSHLDFDYGYGDSTSDYEAFDQAGVEQIFGLQRKKESDCQPGVWTECLDGYKYHFDFIDAQPSG